MTLRHRLFPIVSLFVGLPLCSGAAEHAPDVSKLPPPADAQIDYVRDVRPLFERRCVKCHGAEKQKGGLRLDNRSMLLKGGDEGEAIIPGKSGESRLIHLVGALEPDEIMPPKGEPLSAAEIGMLRAWIDQGADGPADEVLERVQSDHWSLQPVVAPKVPGGSPHPIDAFIRERLKEKGLSPSPEADRTTLIRRLSYDLIGLPPTPGEIDDFVGDASPDAYEKVVERLLASPRYGERWGRHWLDVARYSESQGFEYDKLRPNAWHYRDYVIKMFNEDTPYDRFMREQVAGDVIESATADSIVATSLLVCGSWDEAGNAQSNATQRAITREDELEDLLGTVGQSFLGLTINCARCHTHKFDPIPHEDYYRLKSVFEGVKHGQREIVGSQKKDAYQKEKSKLDAAYAAAAGKLSEIELAGAKIAAKNRPQKDLKPGPSAFVRWNFDASDSGVIAGKTYGGAVIENGRLVLPTEGSYFETEPLPKDIREKTLEAWVSLASLDQRGGAPISIERANGGVFDAIVFGEREPRKWMAGSNGYSRTRNLDIPDETAGAAEFLHVAIVYRTDGSIALFRNGAPLGEPYTPAVPLQTFAAGDARILLGMRHHGGGRNWLTGEIEQAALYDRALTDEEVAASFRSGGFSIPKEDIVASLTPDQRAAREEALAEMQRVRESIKALKPVTVEVSYVGTRTQPAPTKRLVRGDVTEPAEVVTPGTLSAIAELDPDFGLAADAPEGLRRLKFADWLADPRNPLPARVMANRVWHYHFGHGIVATPNDFGISGTRPSHPELLDWMAIRFVESGWSVKALHRLIVGSETYRQQSKFNEKAATVDADNQLFWRFSPRRLEAEILRDAMLAVSGEINLNMGGPSFRPFDALPFPANAYVAADKTGPEFNRRTVYRMNVNSGKDPLLDAFDCPDPAVKTPTRGVTTTPLQALGLMNDSFVQRQAERLSERALEESGGNLPAAIRVAYRLALGRRPAMTEENRAVHAAKERGFASVCWALINSTEFVYVR